MATIPKLIKVTCSCGTIFDREVKRGRPRIWCGGCNGTGPRPSKIETPQTETVSAVPLNPNDALSAVRDQIDAGMAEINRIHKEEFASLVAAGTNPMVAAKKMQDRSYERTIALYSQFGARWRSAARHTASDDDV